MNKPNQIEGLRPDWSFLNPVYPGTNHVDERQKLFMVSDQNLPNTAVFRLVTCGHCLDTCMTNKLVYMQAI